VVRGNGREGRDIKDERVILGLSTAPIRKRGFGIFISNRSYVEFTYGAFMMTLPQYTGLYALKRTIMKSTTIETDSQLSDTMSQ